MTYSLVFSVGDIFSMTPYRGFHLESEHLLLGQESPPVPPVTLSRVLSNRPRPSWPMH